MRACIFLLLLLLPAFSSQNLPESGLELSPVRVVDGRMVVAVLVNEKGPYNFQLDTERADVGRMDTRLAKQLGLKIVGYEEVTQDAYAAKREFLVGVDKLSIGMVSRVNLRLIVGDYNYSPTRQPIDGLIGRGFFHNQLLTLDGPAGQLVMTNGSLTPHDPAVTSYIQPFVLSGKIGSRAARFNLNTGIAQALLFPASQLAGMHYTNTPNRQQITIGTVSFWIQEAVLDDDVTVGPITLKSPHIFYSDKINQINLGVDFLKDHRLTIDQQHRLLRLE